MARHFHIFLLQIHCVSNIICTNPISSLKQTKPVQYVCVWPCMTQLAPASLCCTKCAAALSHSIVQNYLRFVLLKIKHVHKDNNILLFLTNSTTRSHWNNLPHSFLQTVVPSPAANANLNQSKIQLTVTPPQKARSADPNQPT